MAQGVVDPLTQGPVGPLPHGGQQEHPQLPVSGTRKPAEGLEPSWAGSLHGSLPDCYDPWSAWEPRPGIPS